MGYQSEAELEDNLIKKLGTQKYPYIKIENYDALVENFREQINKFNADVLKGNDLSDLRELSYRVESYSDFKSDYPL